MYFISCDKIENDQQNLCDKIESLLCWYIYLSEDTLAQTFPMVLHSRNHLILLIMIKFSEIAERYM